VGFRASAVPWHEEFADECASTTIDTVLRMVEGVGLMHWLPVTLSNVKDVSVSICKDIFGSDCTAFNFVIQCGAGVSEVFELLKASDRRKDWDTRCIEYRVLQACTDNSDLVHYAMRLPTLPDLSSSCVECVAGILRGVDDYVRGSRKDMCLLRAWSDGARGSKVLASRSVKHPIFEQGKTKEWNPAYARPSGFVMEKSGEATSLSYIVNLDNQLLRAVGGRLGVENICMQQIKSLRKLRDIVALGKSPPIEASPGSSLIS